MVDAKATAALHFALLLRPSTTGYDGFVGVLKCGCVAIAIMRLVLTATEQPVTQLNMQLTFQPIWTSMSE